MRVLFMGTPSFAVPALEAILASRHDVVAVVTRPDRPSGRGLALHEPPVKVLAAERGVPVLQPAKIRHRSFLESILSFRPDALAVVAFGRILPAEVLEAVPHGGVNLHASLLPKYRGAAPAAWAIARGEKVTGITTMRMTAELDAGDVYLQRSTPIGDTETTGELEARLAAMGAPFLVETLDAIEAGQLAGIPQRGEEATFAPLIGKKDGRIDWATDAAEIERRVRAFNPWPVAFTRSGETTLRVFRAGAAALPPPRADEDLPPPGTVVEASPKRVLVASGAATALELIEVQPEGRKRMAATVAVSGRYLAAGDRLG